MNLVILAATQLGDGIEAWVTLDDPELLTFTSLVNGKRRY